MSEGATAPDTGPRAVLQISWRLDREQQFVIELPQEDRIVQTGEQIIKACDLQITGVLWSKEFRAMLGRIGEFCASNKEHISACYTSLRSNKICVFFCPRSESFDFELSDALAEFSIEISERYSLVGRVHLRQVPLWDVESFVPSDSLQFTGWDSESKS